MQTCPRAGDDFIYLKTSVKCHVLKCAVTNITGYDLQLSYAIGVAHPLSVSIFHYGTSEKSEKELLGIVKKNFDLRPGVIVR